MVTRDYHDVAPAEERFKQKLLTLGLLTAVRAAPRTLEGDRTPIRVKGKPLSQTITEERR